MPLRPVSEHDMTSRNLLSFSLFAPLSSSMGCDLLEFVDGDRYVHHLVGMADGFGYAVEDLTVVHLERYVDAELAEDALHDLDKLHLVD